MMVTSARDRFLALLHDAANRGSLVKLTLGKYRGAQPSLRNLFVRPVELNSGAHWCFVWRYATRDVTKNFAVNEALAQIEPLVGRDFLDAHLFATGSSAQLETDATGSARIRVKQETERSANLPPSSHDRSKVRLIPSDAPWLRALGVTNERGHPREGMSDKFRQIQKFAENLSHLISQSFPSANESSRTSATIQLSETAPLRVVDMGSGKGYLTFAIAEMLRERARVVGVEERSELVTFCNNVAHEQNFSDFLQFTAGTIENTDLQSLDVLIALHACDTATDDALAKGIAAGAKLLVVSPCCQKELRRQLVPPRILEHALQHGIFQERQAEFVTDALRAQLLEWCGYQTRVFEFISTEHTTKNLMITAVKAPGPRRLELTSAIQEFAAFYGIKSQRLATHLSFDLAARPASVPTEHP
jgi:SAM-dependent methyltransferase